MNDLQTARYLTNALLCLHDAAHSADADRRTVAMIEVIMAAVYSQRENLLARYQIIELPKRKPLGDAA